MKHETGLIVVKFGSECVVGNGGIDEGRIENHAAKLAGLYERASGLIVVTSGAVAQGKTELDLEDTPENEQLFAAAGSTAVVECWKDKLGRHGIDAVGVFVTHREIEAEGDVLSRFQNRATDQKIVSIYNENDALSIIELKKLAYGGDNDGLASHLAIKFGAAGLLLLTSGVDGLLDEQKNLIRTVKVAEIERYKHLCIDLSENGTGGMYSKLQASAEAAKGRVGQVAIANVDSEYEQVISGQTDHCTRVVQ